MKSMCTKLLLLFLFIATLQRLMAFGFAETTKNDLVSGFPVDRAGYIQLFYQDRFDQFFKM